jgi:hypothetical protein
MTRAIAQAATLGSIIGFMTCVSSSVPSIGFPSGDFYPAPVLLASLWPFFARAVRSLAGKALWCCGAKTLRRPAQKAALAAAATGC